MSRAEHDAHLAAHVGEFIAIPLDGGHAYARHRGGLNFAFYDFKTTELASIEEIKRHRVLFTIPATPEALAAGEWKVIGQEPLEPGLQEPPKYFRNPSGSDYVDIYIDGRFQPYAGEDLSSMECAIFWEQVPHIEDRLRKHFAGERDDHIERSKVPRELAERLYREYWTRQKQEKS